MNGERIYCSDVGKYGTIKVHNNKIYILMEDGLKIRECSEEDIKEFEGNFVTFRTKYFNVIGWTGVQG